MGMGHVRFRSVQFVGCGGSWRPMTATENSCVISDHAQTFARIVSIVTEELPGEALPQTL
uniref:Uncharacterized protein n=1 Tax=Candidatus Kentrum sp. MB TaxID=2138164 RepID=A0A450X2K7_9GAMM|nr:MAG: hypothetical protein BECKMB1821G_GA0114241_100514 [Candidatus Kentron sp. MB]